MTDASQLLKKSATEYSVGVIIIVIGAKQKIVIIARIKNSNKTTDSKADLSAYRGESENNMRNDIQKMTKVRFEEMGVKIFQKDIKSVETIKCENTGHIAGWTKDTIKVGMRDGKTYTYISEPTGIYSGERCYHLI